MEPVPIFGARTKKKSRTVETLPVGAVDVVVTPDEMQALKARLDEHIEAHGVSYGFIAALLDMPGGEVC